MNPTKASGENVDGAVSSLSSIPVELTNGLQPSLVASINSAEPLNKFEARATENNVEIETGKASNVVPPGTDDEVVVDDVPIEASTVEYIQKENPEPGKSPIEKSYDTVKVQAKQKITIRNRGKVATTQSPIGSDN